MRYCCISTVLKKIIITSILFNCFAIYHSLATDSFWDGYTTITTFLNNYKRSFTLVEVCSNIQPFSPLIAQQYECTCVLFEPKTEELLQDLVTRQADNILLFSKPMTPDLYTMLGYCEHFDVALIRNFDLASSTEHEYLSPLLALAEHTIIELISPVNSDTNLKNHSLFAQRPVEEIARILHPDEQKIVTYYLSSVPKLSLVKKRWGYPTLPKGRYKIASSFTEKNLIHPKRKGKPWSPGINLFTFANLAGDYPSYAHIYKQITSLNTTKHNDPAMGNMIIEGMKIILIDFPASHHHASEWKKKTYKRDKAAAFFAGKLPLSKFSKHTVLIRKTTRL